MRRPYGVPDRLCKDESPDFGRSPVSQGAGTRSRDRDAGVGGRVCCAVAGGGGVGGGGGGGVAQFRRPLARTDRSVAGCLVAHQTPQTRSAPLTLPPDLARPGACLRTSGRTGSLKKGTAPIVDVHPHLEETS